MDCPHLLITLNEQRMTELSNTEQQIVTGILAQLWSSPTLDKTLDVRVHKM